MHLRADNSKCTGCRLCQLACSLYHFQENNPKKSCLAIVPRFPAPGVFEVRTCTQCGRVCRCMPGGLHSSERERCLLYRSGGVHRLFGVRGCLSRECGLHAS